MNPYSNQHLFNPSRFLKKKKKDSFLSNLKLSSKGVDDLLKANTTDQTIT